MAAQYSNRQFFRKTPNIYLAKYFETKNIHLEVNVNHQNEYDIDVLQDVLNNLPPDQVTTIEAEFQDVNALACEGGILALVDEASFHNDHTFI